MLGSLPRSCQTQRSSVWRSAGELCQVALVQWSPAVCWDHVLWARSCAQDRPVRVMWLSVQFGGATEGRRATKGSFSRGSVSAELWHQAFALVCCEAGLCSVFLSQTPVSPDSCLSVTLWTGIFCSLEHSISLVEHNVGPQHGTLWSLKQLSLSSLCLVPRLFQSLSDSRHHTVVH